MFYHRRTEKSNEKVLSPRRVKRIYDHRVVMGRLEFQVSWEGKEDTFRTWEPVFELFLEEKTKVIDFCKRKGLENELLEGLRAAGHEAAQF